MFWNLPNIFKISQDHLKILQDFCKASKTFSNLFRILQNSSRYAYRGLWVIISLIAIITHQGVLLNLKSVMNESKSWKLKTRKNITKSQRVWKSRVRIRIRLKISEIRLEVVDRPKTGLRCSSESSWVLKRFKIVLKSFTDSRASLTPRILKKTWNSLKQVWKNKRKSATYLEEPWRSFEKFQTCL